MNISLNSEQEKFIQSQIAKGKYANIQQVIDSALKLLEKQEAIPAQLEEKLNYQFDELAGTWNEADEIEFLENTKPCREIEKNLWKSSQFY
ncbi:MAG: type II toxin-antitoxin system ParD family antitoxin [Microcoleaceae cyanobacterium MO_207.B10]|nr:type II toxin-antitoxin system ParD family antitoxin [Microcoleaceae cyanobacterium MO_207.B10]